MTTRPRLATDVNYVNGLAAVALFAVLAYVYLTAEIQAPFGFGDGSITASIGYAMFDILGQIPAGHGETEGFLVAFLVIAIVLDAALDGAVMLARREGEGDTVVTALADGGRRIVGDSNEAEREGASATGEPGDATGEPGDATEAADRGGDD